VRPSKRGFLTVPFALATALWGPAVLAATGGPAVAKVLTSCSFTALKNAVAAGGTVDYGVNCGSPPVSFAATITVPGGLTVNIEANGKTVAFDGGNKVRLFEVTGGTLTIGGIALNNAGVATGNGMAGSLGAAGADDTTGATGGNGTDGSLPGENGGAGHVGGPGGPTTAGHAGHGGKNAQLARGAAPVAGPAPAPAPPAPPEARARPAPTARPAPLEPPPTPTRTNAAPDRTAGGR
jgi:hypothetical protein